MHTRNRERSPACASIFRSQTRGRSLRSDGSLCCLLQDAVNENELRKKQEEAMREKLLAQEAKQHDPKVPKNKHNVNPTSAIPDEVRGETSFFLPPDICPGPGSEEEAPAAGSDRRVKTKTSQRPPAGVRGQRRHHRGHHHRWAGQSTLQNYRGGPQLSTPAVYPLLRYKKAPASQSTQLSNAHQLKLTWCRFISIISGIIALQFL